MSSYIRTGEINKGPKRGVAEKRLDVARRYIADCSETRARSGLSVAHLTPILAGIVVCDNTINRRLKLYA